MNSISIAPDGTLWYMKEQYLNDWSDPENYIWEQQSSLVHADLTGKELLSIPLEELRDPANPDEYLYIGKLVFKGVAGVCTYQVVSVSQHHHQSSVVLADAVLVEKGLRKRIDVFVLDTLDDNDGTLNAELIVKAAHQAVQAVFSNAGDNAVGV